MTKKQPNINPFLIMLYITLIFTLVLGNISPVFAQDEPTSTPEAPVMEPTIPTDTQEPEPTVEIIPPTDAPEVLPTPIETPQVEITIPPTETPVDEPQSTPTTEPGITTEPPSPTPTFTQIPSVEPVTAGANSVPVIASISPTYSAAGSAPFTLTVTGSDFEDGDVIRWEYQNYPNTLMDLPTTYIDSQHLSAEVPTSLLTAEYYSPHLASISVISPAPESTTSNVGTHSVIGFSPALDSKLTYSRPSFSWGTIPAATQYTLQVSLSETFDSFFVNTALTTTNYNYYELENGKQYFWRIRPGFGSTWGDWMPTWHFFSMNPPLAPLLVSPENGLNTTDTTPDFSWQIVPNGESYEIQLSTDPAFASTSIDNILPSGIITYTTPELDGGIYYWRVRGIDSVGVQGAWSEIRSLLVGNVQLNPVPTIISISPSYTAIGNSNSSVVITGTGFIPTSKIVWKDSQYSWATLTDLTATYIDSTHLSTVITDDLLNSLQGYKGYISIINPIPGGGTSSVLPFSRVTFNPQNNEKQRYPFTSFTWTDIDGATQYQIQVSQTDTFAQLVINTATTNSGFSANYPSPFVNGKTYYWHIRPGFGTTWGPWLPTWRFIAYNPPLAPVQTAPADGLVTKDNTPDFSWSSVTNGDRYEIQISNDTTFTNVVNTSIQSSGVLTYTPLELSDGRYYWRVRALDSVQAEGAWSVTRMFYVNTLPTIAPVLSYPADNAEGIRSTPTFTWLTALGASAYQLQYDNNDDFSSPEYTSAYVSRLYLLPTRLMEVGTWYWRVRSRTTAGYESGWSAYRELEIRPAIPAAPVLGSPANATFTNDTTPNFLWNSITGNGITYQIQVDEKPFPTSSYLDPIIAPPASSSNTYDVDVIGLTDPAYTVSPVLELGAGLKYWRVRAFNNASTPEAGSWSTARTFTIDTLNPMPPVLSTPVDNAYGVRTTPTFTWSAVTGASTYTFQYDSDPNFNSPKYTSLALGTTSHLPTLPMTQGIWYWRVCSRDAAQNESDWSAVRKLEIRPALPPAPVLLSPNSSIFTNDTTPDLSWNPITGTGVTYEVQVSSLSSFVYPVEFDMSELGETSLTTTDLTSGLKYWRVRAFNNSSTPEPGSWSTFRTFIIDTDAPAAPVLNIPVNNAPGYRSNPTFSWFATSNASSYQFQIDDDPDFNTPDYTSSFIATISHMPTMALGKGLWYWRVRSRDLALNESGWSTSRAVEIRPAIPGAPTQTSPSNAQITNLNAIEFKWNPVAGTGITYQFQIDNLSTFTAPIDLDISNLNEPAYTAPNLTTGLKFWRVRAFNDAIAPEAGAWSAVRSFTIDTTPPLAPVLQTPVNNAAGVRSTPVFTWSVSAGASTYQFQYDDEESFTNPNYTSAYITTTSHLPSVPMTTGIWYWRVRSRDVAMNESEWSSVRSLEIRPGVPLAPMLDTPATALITNNLTPTFTWKAVSGPGITYQIQIDRQLAFSSPIDLDVNNLDDTTFTTPELAPGLIYWRVRAFNNASTPEPGAWSTVRYLIIDTTAPLAPVLQTPANNAAGVRNTPVFTWSVSAGASMYQFQYNDEEYFTNPIYTSPYISTTSHLPSVPMTTGTWYWRVRSRDAAMNDSDWSSVRTLEIRPVVPLAPILDTPTTANTTNNLFPTFSWKPISGSGITYQIQIDSQSAFTPPIDLDVNNLDDITFTTSELTPGMKYWRVRAFNNASIPEPGAWSTVRYLTIDTTPPLSPILQTPVNNAVGVRVTPVFSWSASAGANAYQYQYDDDANFGSPDYTSTYLPTTYHLPSIPMTTGIWYWRVRSRDAANNESDWSTGRTIEIRPSLPIAPILDSPATASFTNNTSPDFSWKPVAGIGITYQIQIDNLSTFSSPIDVDVNNLDDPVYTATGLNPGLKYWRVRAFNNASSPEAGAWSVVRSFTLDTTAPLPPVLGTPAEKASGVRATPTFTWSASIGANSYQFQYDDDINFGSPDYTSTYLSVTSHIPANPMTIGIWFWRVRSRDAAQNESDWSSGRLLEIRPVVPSTPVLLAPSNAITTPNTSPEFSWNSVSGDSITYEIQIDNSSAFTTPIDVDIIGLDEAKFTAIDLGLGIKYWRVRAFNNSSTPEPGLWSLVRYITIK